MWELEDSLSADFILSFWIRPIWNDQIFIEQGCYVEYFQNTTSLHPWSIHVGEKYSIPQKYLLKEVTTSAKRLLIWCFSFTLFASLLEGFGTVLMIHIIDKNNVFW